MIEITMPRLSDTMEEGAIATWHKKPGDRVEIGDILVEIETDKATMEYEAYEAGTLSKILVDEGENVTIGTPIALIDDGAVEREGTRQRSATVPASEPANEGNPQAGPGTEATLAGRVASASERIETSEPSLDTLAPSSLITRAAEGERRIASPLVRKLARENHLDLSGVDGTGPGARIIRADIEHLLVASAVELGGTRQRSTTLVASEPASAVELGRTRQRSATLVANEPASEGDLHTAPPDDRRASESVPMSTTRRVIARRLGESARSIPHFYVTARADAEQLVALRTELNAQLVAAGRPKVSINDLLIRASALALREHPLVNASYIDDESKTMLVHHRVNVGVAVASANGLVVPVIDDADTKTVTQLGAETKQLVALANEKKLTPAQMSGGTFTISNLGMYGVEEFTAIINPPEGAILAVGGTRREPVVVGDEIVAHHVMRYTLSADHRIVDGALAAQFLQTLTRLIETPWTIIA